MVGSTNTTIAVLCHKKNDARKSRTKGIGGVLCRVTKEHPLPQEVGCVLVGTMTI